MKTNVNPARKMKLSRQTLRTLSSTSLAQAAGGAPPYSSNPNTACTTSATCP